MRVVAVITLLSVGSAGWGLEPTKRVAIVDSDHLELRSGPSMRAPSVGFVKRGDSVIVLREEDTGFYVIQPPAGSISWVRAVHLGKVDLIDGKGNAVVEVTTAPISAGTNRMDAPSTQTTVSVPHGTIVEIVGNSVAVDGKNWYPIQPPEGDVRFIPKAAIRQPLTAMASPPAYSPVSPPAYVSGTVDPKSPGGSATPIQPAVANLPRALTDHRLWNQAAQAERQADYALAESLYAKIYSDLWDSKADREALVICYNRAIRCQELRKKGAATTVSGGGERVVDAKPASTVKETTPESKWIGPGYLREAQKLLIDGNQAFAVEDDRGAVLYYVTAGRSVNLREHNGRRVQLYGQVNQRAELYRPHMIVEKVEIPR